MRRRVRREPRERHADRPARVPGGSMNTTAAQLANTPPTPQRCPVVVSGAADDVTLHVAGELDAHTWRSVESALEACLAIDCDRVVVDLLDVSFMSVSVCLALHQSVCRLNAALPSVMVRPSDVVEHTV